MIKLVICKSATFFFCFLAIGVFAKLQIVAPYLQHGDMVGAALILLGGIFGTQWVEYQRRTGTTEPRPDPG